MGPRDPPNQRIADKMFHNQVQHIGQLRRDWSKIKGLDRMRHIQCALWALATALTACHGMAGSAPRQVEQEALRCEVVEEKPVMGNTLKTYVIGKAWSGTRVAFGTLTKDDSVYFGYYDPERFLRVGSLDLRTGQLCSLRLPSRFNGWDAHNRVVLAFDQYDRLHVAGNSHGTPLVYATTQRKNSIEGLALRPMTGQDEERVTYPQFYTTEAGGLLFAYRTGGSGNGAWIINEFRNGAWTRHVNGQMYGNRWQDKPISAYPSYPYLDDNGVYHIAIVWRLTGDVSTNVAISYVQTHNMRDFKTADGKLASLPILPRDEMRVLSADIGSGLLNNAQVVADRDGVPYIFYTKYDANGKNAVYVAKFLGDRWLHRRVASSRHTEKISGTGTLGIRLRFSDISITRENVQVTISFKNESARRYVLSSEDLTQLQVMSPRKSFDAGFKWNAPPGLLSAREVKRPIFEWGGSGARSPIGQLRYFTQPTARDRPQACTTQKPTACEPPPSDLILLLK